jgi:hypothetical protein
MKDLKTTIFGTLASICTGLALLELPFKEYFAAGAVIFGTLFSLVSKDKKFLKTSILPKKGL